MNKFAIALTALSFNAFATNPELESIFKKYESTLMNLRVGMTQETKIFAVEFDTNEPGTIRDFINSSISQSVILKVEGTRLYEYMKELNPQTGEVTTTVNLHDYDLSDINIPNVKNVIVKDDILSFDSSDTDQTETEIYRYTSKLKKDLRSSFFCGSQSLIMASSTNVATGEVTPMNEDITSTCTADMAREEMKKLDLKQINFCDMSTSVNNQVNCEIKDMSFLISEL